MFIYNHYHHINRNASTAGHSPPPRFPKQTGPAHPHPLRSHDTSQVLDPFSWRPTDAASDLCTMVKLYPLFQTFCVVSKRFRKNYIHRFTATRSLFWWSPWSPWRRACVYLSTNQYFDYFVMATILLNCVFLAMSETVEEAE